MKSQDNSVQDLGQTHHTNVIHFPASRASTIGQCGIAMPNCTPLDCEQCRYKHLSHTHDSQRQRNLIDHLTVRQHYFVLLTQAFQKHEDCDASLDFSELFAGVARDLAMSIHAINEPLDIKKPT